jgi:aquaporin NIP
MFTTSLIRRAGAECIGSYALVTAGCGAIIVNSLTGSLGHVGIAFTFGFIILVMIAATGHLSGAHFNPAVTVAFALTRHFPWKNVSISPCPFKRELIKRTQLPGSSMHPGS